jgi:acyl-CoA synthetase (AMP-forming)/AMP-acid ligase II
MLQVWPLSRVRKACIFYSYLKASVELASHPHVLEVSVIARKHLKWGERPMAFVTLHPQHAHVWAGRHHKFGEDLKEHAKSRLPGFARPEWVEVLPELPVRRKDPNFFSR